MLERSRDYAAIKALATHPAVFPFITDDYHPDPAAWQPPQDDHVYYLVARDAGGPFGLGIFIPENFAAWRAHVAFLPRSRGAKALVSWKAMLRSIWETTTAERIFGEIDHRNRAAIRFCLASGFSRYGTNPRSVRRGGELRDQVCLGISKG